MSAQSADYTRGVTSLNSTQAKIWFKPTTSSALVDVHYLISGLGQQNFRMTNNAGTWEKTVSNLTSGTVIEYWFTYEKGGPLFDTPHFTYTHAGTTPTTGPTPPPAADYTQGVTSLNSTQAKIWFKPTTSSTLVDVHYFINGANQQNFRMTNNAGTWEKTVSNLTSGTVIEYWFTYEKGGPLFDTPHFTYTHGGGGTTVATPTFSPPGGTYNGTQTVTISTATSGATIRYTTDGSTPTASSPLYSGPITVSSSRTLKAIALKSGMTTSAVATATYTISNTVATPTFNPPGGTYNGTQTVTISTATSGATIRYTTDGSTPTASSPLYSGPITVSSSRTLKAIALKSGMTTSAVATATYTICTTCGSTCTGTGPTGTYPLCLQNNTGGRWTNSQIYLTILGMPVPGEWHYLRPDGSAAHINHLDANAPNRLTKNGVNYPNMSFTLAQATKVTMPTRWEGGRIYISLGSPMYIPVSPDDRGWGGPDLHNPNDPNADVYYDWYELTYQYGVIPFGGNTTQVDQFGFPMTARLRQAAIGYDQTVGITLSRAQVMSQYTAAVGAAFDPLANSYRIVAPRSSASFKPGGSQANYMQAYIDQVWNFYTTNQFTLTRLNQTFSGRVVNGQLQFTKDGVGPFVLNKPTTKDVVECSGALASAGMSTTALELGAEFCAAFNRGIALDTTKWWGSPTGYYQNAIKNDYAGFFHQISIAGRAYGFAYDDINDQSSVKILPNANPPSSLTIGIGW